VSRPPSARSAGSLPGDCAHRFSRPAPARSRRRRGRDGGARAAAPLGGPRGDLTPVGPRREHDQRLAALDAVDRRDAVDDPVEILVEGSLDADEEVELASDREAIR
jgi:hypothetical protein